MQNNSHAAANCILTRGPSSSSCVSPIYYSDSPAYRGSTQLLREAEAHRLEQVTSKLRNQRMEAAERKKEREVKLTDRLPPTKRVRKHSFLVLGRPVTYLPTGASGNQPKTLFQKARNEVKLRKSLYTTRILPPMAQGKTYRISSSSASVKPSTPPCKRSNNYEITESVVIKCPSFASTAPSSVSPLQSPDEAPASAPPSPSKPSPFAGPHSTVLSPQSSPTQAEARLPIQKKDPMASLFMPKHRAFSQLPSQGKNIRSMPAR